MQAFRNCRSHKTVSAFAQKELSNYLQIKKASVLESINNEKDDYLLNVNHDEYIEFKMAEAFVEKLEIHHENITLSSSEEFIPREYFPNRFMLDSGPDIKKDVISFYVPFSGDSTLFECRPSTRIVWTMNIFLSDEEFHFKIINFQDDSERISREKDENIKFLLKQMANVNNDVERYNSSLNAEVKQAYSARKEKILTKSDVLSSLGIPIRKTENVSSTFSVPSPQTRKKIPVSKPAINETSTKPDPTLSESTYHEILRLIHDVGKEFERLPSLYANKEEEHLRDHFLMMLEPNFEGSATGETFNKTGKTDILLRYEGTNVFIAECKFWKGKKSFLDTISQLLRYLTWRDSKASVIMFVPNKEFSSVLQTAQDAISEYPNFLVSTLTLLNTKALVMKLGTIISFI